MSYRDHLTISEQDQSKTAVMELKTMLKDELLFVCEDLSIEVEEGMGRSQIVKLIMESASEGEIETALNTFKRFEEKEREKEERELRRIELENESRRLAQTSGGAPERVSEIDSYRMDKYLNPFQVGKDIGIFLGSFERTCERMNFAPSTWSQRLLSLLPYEAAEVITRLSAQEADDYAKVKAALLKKYRLSAEAFRQRFRNTEKKDSEGYPDFAYGMKRNLIEWLKSAESYESRDRVIETICLEQFYRSIPQNVRLWVQDRDNVNTVERAAELAEDYAMRRKLSIEGGGPDGRKGSRKEFSFRKGSQAKKLDNPRGETSTPENKGESASGGHSQRKEFEAFRPIRCYNCQKTGHIAANCRSPKVVFSYADESDENIELLRPYLHDLEVNGKPCKVLRDSGATMDIVHPSYITVDDFTGEVAWIKQVVEENSVCLPMAKVTITGPFGEIVTEAAVSTSLSLQYPYIFSNRSDRILRERGQKLGEGTVQALTRSKARELASVAPEEPIAASTETELGNPAGAQIEPADKQNEALLTELDHDLEGESTDQQNEALSTELDQGELADTRTSKMGSVLSPASKNFDRLVRVNRESLAAQQENDPSLTRLQFNAKEGIARGNVTLHKKGGLLYRHYRDKRGRILDQLVVPREYREDLLNLCHGNGWSGHLGIKKSKERLLMEYYWPGCFKDVEEFVRSCDTCQRTGKPGEKWKAPLKLVPIISEPFRRLVIDIVGPLPATKSGYRYLFTMLCPATKFPEAIPLKEPTSTEIVDALLSVFTRVGFPAEIQADQGSVFTSSLTTTFLQKFGIRLIHSSVYHPQSNSVERWHSVLKRVLRALCYEHKEDWESCLPATLFALRTVPHEATGFSPAELVYGRTLRSPLRMLREMWEERGDSQTVVEYVLNLLERLSTTQGLVEKNMDKAQRNAKLYYDRNARLRTFSIGDQVMILRPSRKNKLEVHWDGPVEVLHRLSDTNYALKVPGRRKEVRIYHCNLMKPYVERHGVVNLTLKEPEEIQSEFDGFTKTSDSEISLEEVVAFSVGAEALKPEQVQELKELLRQYLDRFSHRPGRTELITHEIELTSAEPVRSKPYRVSPRQKEIMEAEIRRMLELGVIEPAESDYTSPLILVEAPNKDPRPCVDYRRLNAITRDQLYPIPNIEERIERVSAAKYISTLDLVRGYWQVPLSESASRYAAFISPVGTFRPLVLSFGLKNAPFSFSKLMDIVLKDLQEFALPYLDDVAIFSDSWEDHLKHLREVFSRLRGAGLTMKAEKCSFGCSQVTYLGHVVGQGTRQPAELKTAAIAGFSQPRTKTDIRSFLGLVGYYQRYIPNFSQLASPLTDALRKGEPTNLHWDGGKEAAFQGLKALLVSRPVLRAPDYSKEFIVQCDASDRGMGVVLTQVGDDHEEHPILYASRKLTVREEAYSASEKECACLVWAAQKLSCYLYGARFIFETDHCPLTWLNQMSHKNGRLLRWSLTLQQYNFEVRYKKGKLHGNADGLSRLI